VLEATRSDSIRVTDFSSPEAICDITLLNLQQTKSHNLLIGKLYLLRHVSLQQDAILRRTIGSKTEVEFFLVDSENENSAISSYVGDLLR
jgi:BarA-like signal transduction histidine kinase